MGSGKKCWVRRKCVYCGQEAIHEPKCLNPPHCSNCYEAHPASSKSCRVYEFEKEISTLKTEERISFKEARSRVRKNFVMKDSTFAEVLRRGRPNTAPYTRQGASQEKGKVAPTKYSNNEVRSRTQEMRDTAEASISGLQQILRNESRNDKNTYRTEPRELKEKENLEKQSHESLGKGKQVKGNNIKPKNSEFREKSTLKSNEARHNREDK